MNEILTDIKWIEKTKNKVETESLHAWGPGFDILTDSINIFFNLTHFLTEEIDPETNEGAFFNTAYSSYLRLPYTMYCIRNNWLNGFYLEAIVLLRHLIEGFACIRYFSNHKERVIPHYTAKRHRDRVTFREMFDELAPGFYLKIYGKIYSNFTHGGVGTLATRVKYTSPTEGKVYVGCQFDETYSKMIIGQSNIYSYGYLCYLDEFFPTINSRISEELINKIDAKKSELKHILNSEKINEVAKEFWQEIIKPFVEN